MEKLTETQEKEIKKEVRKILAKKLTEQARNSARAFKEEFKKQTLTAITAAFAFLIALSWRSPIEKSINNIVTKLKLNESAAYYEYIAAIVITIIGVLVIMFLARWAAEKK